MKQEYKLTQDDMTELLEASKPVVAIMLHIGGGPPTPQENVNAVWQKLGDKYGFVWHTATASTKGGLFIMAEPMPELVE